MNLNDLLNTAELNELNSLVLQAHQAGAGAVRVYSEAQHVVVIGITSGGQLLTWFAGPAHSEVEALVTERIVLTGIRTAGLMMSAIEQSSQDIAADAINKAQKMH